MSPSIRPAMVPFDPDEGGFPSALQSLFARPAATVPALLVVAGTDARRSGWADRASVAIASGWAERGGAIVLVDLDLDGPGPRGVLAIDEGEGVADAFEFGLSLAGIMRPAPGAGIRVVLPGTYVPDPAALLADARWQQIAAASAADQETLLIHVPAGTLGLDALARHIGQAMVLAGPDEAEAIAASLPSSCTVTMILRQPDPQDGAPAADHTTALPTRGAEHGTDDEALPVDPVPGDPATDEDELQEPGFIVRADPRRRRVSPVLLGLLVVALGTGGWIGARHFFAAPATPPAAQAVQPADEAEPSPPPPPAEPVLTEIPYSVAIEAHPDYALASERVESLRAAERDLAFYLAPIVVDSVIYYRVMSGPVTDSAAAAVLMRRLVEEGHKSEADAWAIRPTRWAFDLGEFDTREAADTRGVELHEQGIPTYVVEIAYTHGPSRFRLYAGAYEGPVQAEVMAQLLRSAGVPASLIRRTGRPAA